MKRTALEAPADARARRPRRRPRSDASSPKRAVGWCERVGFPALGIEAIKAKIDTGARTSALHAYDLEPFSKDGDPWIRFTVHPDGTAKTATQACLARIVGQRMVADTSGRRERRYIIETTLCIGDLLWPIEISLTQRSYMRFDCLIGRTGVRGRFLVDPGRAYLAGRPTNGRSVPEAKPEKNAEKTAANKSTIKKRTAKGAGTAERRSAVKEDAVTGKQT